MKSPNGVDSAHRTVDTIGVIIPARNEEELLPGCLAALTRAVRQLPAAIAVTVVVVADSCTDRTVEQARAEGATVLVTEGGNVGSARALGCGLLLDQAAEPDRLWLATTDADSRVPAHWLRAQLGSAAAGWEAVVGTVTVRDWSEHSPAVARRFLRSYRHQAAAHPHVHGANLGVSATAYAAAGGFPAVAVGEDQALVDALEAAGRQILRTAAIPVETSARRTPRAVGGFGSLLVQLADGVEPRP